MERPPSVDEATWAPMGTDMPKLVHIAWNRGRTPGAEKGGERGREAGQRAGRKEGRRAGEEGGGAKARKGQRQGGEALAGGKARARVVRAQSERGREGGGVRRGDSGSGTPAATPEK